MQEDFHVHNDFQLRKNNCFICFTLILVLFYPKPIYVYISIIFNKGGAPSPFSQKSEVKRPKCP